MALAKCDCKNAYQDEKYGQNIRVHNLMAKSKETTKMGRCTVCSKERAI
ncbi:hypothetical protein M0R72_08350 [Candidatus Pacearchaeota archaeon]|jgi:hypothetical protein|nr:hypothetical protein [Candidatus Pacearchaeota archaeon]